MPADEEVVIRKLKPEITVDDLFRRKSAEAWREIYEGAYEWGDDLGREHIEE